MKLAGRVWNTLDEDDRMALLRNCNIITHESIKKIEVTRKWEDLWPMTQDALLEVDFSRVLGRDVQPL